MTVIKKKFLFCILIFSQFLIFSNERFLSFTAGLSTGIPFYKNAEIQTENQITPELGEKEISVQNKIVIGTFANINFNLIKQASFFIGVDLLADFNFNSNEHNNFLHISFPAGFKIYPNLAGFNFGVAYALGIKANFFKNAENERKNGFSSWGNGFKFFIEYDFAYGSKYDFLPAAGCSWTFMPRGNYAYDNLLTFYISEKF